MTELDKSALKDYLAQHYLSAQQLSTLSEISEEELYALIQAQLIPEASYTVTASDTIRSFVFGEMPAPGALPGQYFSRANVTWIKRARTVIRETGRDTAYATLKQRFTANFCAALADLNATTWHLTDSYNEDGTTIENGLQVRAESAWKYFLNGTFGLCIVQPVSEAVIAHKEILQEKLSALTENGQKSAFTPEQSEMILSLIDDYAAAAMPFSPIEYPISSRKRLADDLRARLRA